MDLQESKIRVYNSPQIVIDPKEELRIVLKIFYYRPQGYYRTPDKLLDAVKEEGYNFDISDVREWLNKQVLHIIYSPRPKHIPRPSFNNVRRPNALHFADIIYMPWDLVRGKTYKYALSIIDCASRYKWQVPLTELTAKHVSKAFKRVYTNPNIPLVWPWVLQVDQGGEFKRECKKLMEKHGVRIRIVYAKRTQGTVECFNKNSAKKAFRSQYAMELVTNDVSRAWVEGLEKRLIAMNNEKTRLLGMKPVDAIKLRKTPKIKVNYRRPVGLEEECLPITTKVRYLLLPEDLEGKKRRATDPNWSLLAFEIDRIIVDEDKPVLYYLKKGVNSFSPPKRSFVREELIVDDPEFDLPPRFTN